LNFSGAFIRPAVRGITTLTNGNNIENNVTVYVDGIYNPSTISPTYYSDDFWKLPGYLGANPTQSLSRARIQQYKTSITKIVTSDEARRITGLRVTSAAVGKTALPAAFRFEKLPDGDLKGATLTINSGAAKGAVFSLSSVVESLVSIDIGPDAFDSVTSIKIGDEVSIDNSIYLAIQTYHRHQVPSADFYVWNQFRGPDGKPLYPQRPKLLGPEFAERAAGSVENGHFASKMILIESLMDEYAYPWGADWYRSRVKETLGSRLDDNFRLWFTDHEMHGSPAPGPIRTRIVAYTTLLQQALRDLSAWVEKGVAPPPSARVFNRW
jgi:hypothetical protein